MTVEQVAKAIVKSQQECAKGEQVTALLKELRAARAQWLQEERLAILSLVKAWIGDTVESHDLIQSINLRSREK